jgi:hypothetical protein
MIEALQSILTLFVLLFAGAVIGVLIIAAVLYISLDKDK